MTKSSREIRCIQCGASATAKCDCGVGYHYLSEIAKLKIKENPGLTDGAIAIMIGRCSDETVRLARKQLPKDLATKRRKGKDDKSYPVKRKKKRPLDDYEISKVYERQFEQHLSALAQQIVTMNKIFTEKFGEWQSYPISECTYDLVQQAAKAWNELASRYKFKPTGNVVNLKSNGGCSHVSDYS